MKYLVKLLLALLCMLNNSYAQTALEKSLAKIDPEIVAKARIGTPQNLIIVIDQSDIQAEVKAHRNQLAASRAETNATAASDVEGHEKILSDELSNKLQARKEKIFPQGHRGRVVIGHSFSHLPIVSVTISDLDSLLDLLSESNVLRIEAMPIGVPLGSSNLQIIGQPTTVASGKTGAGTRVAIIDTGWAFGTGNTYNRAYEAYEWDLNGNIYTMCTYWQCSNASHAQVVSGVVADVSPSTGFVFLRGIYDPDGSSSPQNSAILLSLNWVAANYYKSPRIVAVNMSFALGTPSGTLPTYTTACQAANSAISSAIRTLANSNVVPVAASGNNGTASGMTAPACMIGVLSVGAVTDSPTGGTSTYSTGLSGQCTDPPVAADIIPCFSNSSVDTTILAPGVGICSNAVCMSGTSVAAPHVTGAIAILRGTNAFPADTTTTQTINRLTSTGKPVFDVRNNRTYPRLQLDQAAGLGIVTVPTPPNCSKNPRLCV